MSWICRVPSYSNVADAPSRNDVSLLLKLQASDDSVEATKILLKGRFLLNHLFLVITYLTYLDLLISTYILFFFLIQKLSRFK